MADINSQAPTRGERKAPIQNDNVDAEQLATFSEGKVADAVKKTSGRDKPRKDDIEIEDYTSNLERLGRCAATSECELIRETRKKAEQAEAREQVKAERRAGVDVDGSLGQGRLHNEDNSDL